MKKWISCLVKNLENQNFRWKFRISGMISFSKKNLTIPNFLIFYNVKMNFIFRKKSRKSEFQKKFRISGIFQFFFKVIISTHIAPKRAPPQYMIAQRSRSTQSWSIDWQLCDSVLISERRAKGHRRSSTSDSADAGFCWLTGCDSRSTTWRAVQENTQGLLLSILKSLHSVFVSFTELLGRVAALVRVAHQFFDD